MKIVFMGTPDFAVPCLEICHELGEVLLVVEIEIHAVGEPFHRVDVEIVPRLPIGQTTAERIVVFLVVPEPVYGREDLARFVPHGFHDVDLAALGPADRVDVRAQHPDRRPLAPPARQLGPHLDAPVGRLKQPLGREARRRVVTEKGDDVRVTERPSMFSSWHSFQTSSTGSRGAGTCSGSRATRCAG